MFSPGIVGALRPCPSPAALRCVSHHRLRRTGLFVRDVGQADGPCAVLRRPFAHAPRSRGLGVDTAAWTSLRRRQPRTATQREGAFARLTGTPAPRPTSPSAPAHQGQPRHPPTAQALHRTRALPHDRRCPPRRPARSAQRSLTAIEASVSVRLVPPLADVVCIPEPFWSGSRGRLLEYGPPGRGPQRRHGRTYGKHRSVGHNRDRRWVARATHDDVAAFDRFSAAPLTVTRALG
jgi:hypothetical protein